MRSGVFKVFLILWLIGSFVAGLLHFFFPEIISNSSSWNISLGWQRELALWNAGIIFAILYTFIKNDVNLLRFMVWVLTFISFFLGTHHAIALLTQVYFVHLLGFILNYAIFIFGVIISRRRKHG